MKQTTNYALKKPEPLIDNVDIDVINGNMDKIDSVFSNTAKFEKAGGTATGITLNGIILEDGVCKTFIVTSNNNGAATTINGKKLYKPNTNIAPALIAGKAVTVWYDLSGDCYLIKASLEAKSDWNEVDINSDAYIKNKPTSLPANGGNAATTDKLNVKDRRNINDTPEWYINNHPSSIVTELKIGSIVGLPIANFVTLITNVPWVDSSTGFTSQTAIFSSHIYRRGGTSLTTWGEWYMVYDNSKILKSTNVPSGSYPDGSLWFQYE